MHRPRNVPVRNVAAMKGLFGVGNCQPCDKSDDCFMQEEEGFSQAFVEPDLRGLVTAR